FFSVHQFPLYPGTGWITERGEGEGLGYTVNVPLPAGCGDPTYRRVLTEVLRPLADRYRPDLVLVSAGYDGHWLDPLASMRLSVDGYADLMRTLTAIAETHCDGRMVVVLEGGYDLRALAHGVAATCHVLLEEPAGPDPLGPPPDGDEPAEAASRLAAVLALAVGTSTPG
ncbi:MAG TPA: histone deacetylase, partial [Chloroflexota bacterium]